MSRQLTKPVEVVLVILYVVFTAFVFWYVMGSGFEAPSPRRVMLALGFASCVLLEMLLLGFPPKNTALERVIGRVLFLAALSFVLGYK